MENNRHELVAEARRLGEPTSGDGWRRMLWKMADELEASLEAHDALLSLILKSAPQQDRQNSLGAEHIIKSIISQRDCAVAYCQAEYEKTRAYIRHIVKFDSMKDKKHGCSTPEYATFADAADKARSAFEVWRKISGLPHPVESAVAEGMVGNV